MHHGPRHDEHFFSACAEVEAESLAVPARKFAGGHDPENRSWAVPDRRSVHVSALTLALIVFSLPDWCKAFLLFYFTYFCRTGLGIKGFDAAVHTISHKYTCGPSTLIVSLWWCGAAVGSRQACRTGLRPIAGTSS